MKNSEKNIVLIGMPGSGKTTIGQLLSKELHMIYVDVDQYIEKKSNKTINELFQIGEDHFRALESGAVRELSNLNRAIISTGGGVIKNKENIAVLKENGIIIFIDRPIELIVTDLKTSDRPLLKEGTHKLYKLYEERYTLYKENCDFQITNNNGIEDILKQLVDLYSKFIA